MSTSPKARAVVLPITTLGELLGYGFEVHVWCPRCHQFRRPTIPADRLDRRFAGVRFRCHCGAPGYPSFRPGPNAAQRRGDTIIDLYCPHCLPPWEMIDARLEPGQAFACPGCRRPPAPLDAPLIARNPSERAPRPAVEASNCHREADDYSGDAPFEPPIRFSSMTFRVRLRPSRLCRGQTALDGQAA